jgi:hypothetical protein
MGSSACSREKYCHNGGMAFAPVGCVNPITSLVFVDQSAEEVVSSDGGRVRGVIDSDAVAAVRRGELERTVGPVLVEMLGVDA